MPMNEFPLTPLPPDEALYAFLDGELDQHHEQPLFDELAAQPELRTEMKDLLAIRNAVHRDAVFPPPQSDMGLAPLPLAGVTGAAGAGAVAGAVAPSSAFWPSIISGVGGAAIGAAIVAFLMSSPSATQEASSKGIAGVTSTAATAGQSATPERIVIVDTVVVTRRVATPATPAVSLPVAEQTNAVDLATMDVEPAAPDASPSDAPALIESVEPLSTITRNTVSASQSMHTMSTIAQPQSQLPVRLGFRSLASGLPSREATPNSVESAVLPNTAFSLTIPLSSDHRVGVEMGSESFRQTFTGFDGYRTAEWIQTPVLFWLGATYVFEPMSLEFLPGLRPFGNASVGTVFAQGPIARGTVGLAYQPIGPVRFTVGVDGAALMYSFQGSWFTSTKLGLSYGLSIDMGGWK